MTTMNETLSARFARRFAGFSRNPGESLLPPFVEAVDRFVELVRESQVVVVAAPTGAGKSTIAPLALLKAGFAGRRMIGVTQPRRPVARNLAKWVAHLEGSKLGEVVGYQIGQERSGEVVQLKYMTEGILLAELHSDPLLRRYSVIVLDEVHERSVFQDLLIALSKSVLTKRSDLKLILMSATIDAERFSRHFNNAPVFRVEGRQYPVEIRYAPRDSGGVKETLEWCAAKVNEILRSGERGDIITFLPDLDSIRKVEKFLSEMGHETGSNLRVVSLYGAQDPDEQEDAQRPSDRRRVILSTNIAETGLTPVGVVFTVDSGLIKQTEYVDASMSALRIVEHSKAGCDQRAGRVGRTQPGVCFRAYTRENFEARPAFTAPEIQRTALDQVLLKVMCLGYAFDEVKTLELMDPPSARNWKDARERLILLSALDHDCNVTDDGHLMDSFQTEPIVGRLLLSGYEQVVTVAACLSATRSPFVRPSGKEDEADMAHTAFKEEGSDPLTALNAWNAWDATGGDHGWARDNYLSSRALDEMDRLRVQFRKAMERSGVEVTSGDAAQVRKAIAAGLIVNIAFGRGKQYSCCGRDDAFIHLGSVLFGDDGSPPFLVCQRVVETTRVFMRGCHKVEKEWLGELIPEGLCEHSWDFVDTDPDYDSLVLRQTRSWNGVKIATRDHTDLPDSAKPVVVDRLMADMLMGHGFHPSHGANYRVRMVIREQLKRFDPYLSGWSVVETAMRAFLAQRVEAIRTVSELMATDLTMTAGQFVSEEISQEIERQAAQRLEEQKAREQEEARRRQEEAAQRALLAARFQALNARLAAIGGKRLLKTWDDKGLVESVEWMVRPTTYSTVENVSERLDKFEALVIRLEASQSSRFEMTALGRDEVLSQYPNCPMCGKPWDEKLGCDGPHNARRVVPLGDGRRTWLIAEFVTNRGDAVASVGILSSSRVELAFRREEGEAWDGRTFKRLEIKLHAAILPESLVGSRDAIVETLAELREAKEAHERALAQLEEIKKGVAGGSVVILFVRIDKKSGRPYAIYNAKRYDAEFGDWPTKEGRWFCRLKPETSLVGNSMILEREAGSFAAREEIEELRGAISELFEGIPQDLLN
jgi:HrpA-like RNA helicase